MNFDLSRLFNNFITHPGVATESVERAFVTLDLVPPADYLATLQFTNGGEGFIGTSYFRLYSIDEVLSLNKAYQVGKFTPGLVIFGSTGGGEAFAFDARKMPIEVVKVPFIPMDFEFVKLVGKTFAEFLATLSTVETDGDSSVRPEIELSAVGKEVHEIQPIVFGGDPVNPKNKALVPSEKHAELCVFWNGVYQRVTSERDRG